MKCVLQKTSLTFFLFYFPILIFAQSADTISLEGLTEGSKEYFYNYQLLIEAVDPLEVNKDSIIDDYLEKAEQHMPSKLAFGYLNKAFLLEEQSKYTDALLNYQKAKDRYQLNEDYRQVAKTLYYMAISSSYATKDYKKSIPYLEESIEICKEHGFDGVMSTDYYIMGYCYRGLYEEENTADHKQKDSTSQNYLTQAIYNFDEALKLAETKNDQSQIDHILSQKVNIYLYQENYAAARDLATQLLQADSFKGKNGTLHLLHIVLGKAYFGLQQYELAYNQIDSAEQVLPAEQSSMNDLLHVYDTKYTFALELKNYKTALDYYTKSEAIKDSLWSNEKKIAYEKLTVEYETLQKEQENLALTKEKQLLSTINKWISAIAVLFLLSLLLLSYFYYKNRQQQRLILAQKNELEQLDELKMRFFTNVAHELRTPLTLITAPLKMLLKSQTLDDYTLITLQSITNNSKDLLVLVDEILDLSRFNNHQLSIDKQSYHFLTIINSLGYKFDLEAQQREIDYSINYALPYDLYLIVDKNKISKIVSNLLTNAFKFSKSGDSIELLVQEHQKFILVIVTDTGLGIHPDDLPHIFKRFYQSTQSNMPLSGGLGIGLALSNELAHLMNGELSVQSEYGKGSTFTFKFPQEIGNSTNALKDDIKEQSISGILPSTTTFLETSHTILIVEDNIQLQSLVQELLPSSFTFLFANNGKEALQILNKSTHIDLIISDIMMPDMDGFQLLDHIKNSDAWKWIPIIMLTARTSIEDKIKALTVGVDDYISKPFEPEELKARVINLLQNSQQKKNQLGVSEDKLIDVTIPNLEAADYTWLKEVEKVCFKNIHDSTFNMNHLAQKLAISERHLRRKIKQITGITAGNYIKEIRLEKARQLIENRVLTTLAEVSYEVGFNTPSYFAKLYEKRFGKNPVDLLK